MKIFDYINRILYFNLKKKSYRGSSGYGQDSIDCLPGKIGLNDVNDCQVKIHPLLNSFLNFKNYFLKQAAEYAMKEYNFKKAVKTDLLN